MHRRPEPYRRRQPRGLDHLYRFLMREMRLPASGIVPEDSRWEQARCGQGEAPERSPDEILGTRGTGERTPERGIRSGSTPDVKDGEVGIFLGRLDEARAELGLAKNRLEILGEEIPREVQLPGP